MDHDISQFRSGHPSDDMDVLLLVDSGVIEARFTTNGPYGKDFIVGDDPYLGDVHGWLPAPKSLKTIQRMIEEDRIGDPLGETLGKG